MDEAFSAGVEPGGLRTTQEIRILLCYMLSTVNRPMRRDDVIDIIIGGGMANYFDTEEAIDDLVRLQHLAESEDRRIATTVTGAQIGESLAVRIPYTLRERSVEAALRLLRRRDIEKENTVTVERQASGGYHVTCTVQDQGHPLLAVTLRVADEYQANQIREQFYADPALLYRSTLAVLTGDAGIQRGGTQLVVKLK